MKKYLVLTILFICECFIANSQSSSYLSKNSENRYKVRFLGRQEEITSNFFSTPNLIKVESSIESVSELIMPGDWIYKGEHSWTDGLFRHAMAYTGDDKIVLFGGHAGGHIDGTFTYDLSSNHWQMLVGITPHPSARYHHAMTYIGDDKALLFGGHHDFDGNFNETWIFDLSDEHWTLLVPGTSPTARYNFDMAYLGNDRVLLFGGTTGGNSFNDETWIFDLNENNWIQLTPAPSPPRRYAYAMARSGNQKVVLYGGIDRITGAPQSCSDTWIFDIVTQTWSEGSPENSPPPRFGHAMASLGDGRVLLYGGYGPVPGMYGHEKNDVWIYDVENDIWTEQHPDIRPPAIYDHALAETGLAGGDVVLFGGNRNFDSFTELSRQTWIYENPETVLTITSPNGGESFEAGSEIIITWDSPGIPGRKVDIEFSADGGSSWTLIFDDIADDGSESWTLPDEVYDNCLIRITESDGIQSDISDGGFEIAYARAKICFPPLGGVPGVPGPPVIDGSIADDLGWRGASRRVYGTGAEPVHVVLQTLSHRTDPYIYLSFEVNNDPSFDSRDVIVLNFRSSATGGPEDDIRVFIFPLTDACGAGQEPCDPDEVTDRNNVPPREILIWKNSSAWTAIDPSIISNIDAKVSSVARDSYLSWALEIQMPTTKDAGGEDWINIENEFLFYSNVVRVTGPVDFGTEFRFPRSAPEINGNISDYFYDPSDWGMGIKGTSSKCNGVWLAWNDIGTKNEFSSQILFGSNQTNRFFANVQNNTLIGEIPDPAPKVNVLFRLANWGIPGPGNWTTITADNPGCATPNISSNPTCPKDIPAAIGTTPGTYEFNLNYIVPESQFENFRTHPHQCLLAEMDSRSDVDFLTKSVYRNMDYVDASTFKRNAEVGTKGYGEPPTGSEYHEFFLHSAQLPLNTKSTTMDQKDPRESKLRFAVHGYRSNGRFIIIDDKKYALTDAVGSFGYYVSHNAPVLKWKQSLKGVNHLEGYIYKLNVAPNTAAELKTIIQPVEKHRWSYSVHAGSSTPTGSFASKYGTGISAMLDFDFHFTQDWAILLLLGYHEFKATNTGIDNETWWNTSFNMRWYSIFKSKWSFYFGAGPGIYFSEAISNEIGGNAGLGFNYRIKPLLQLELGSDYHISSGDRKFWQNHLGIVGRF